MSRPSSASQHRSQPVDTWIVVIGGYGQTPFTSGLIRVWRWLYSHLACASCAVTVHRWDDDWRGLAAYMRSQQVQRVLIVGYSWGIGHGAMTLARELKAKGLDVEVIVSCDGIVYDRWFRWRALLNWFRPPRISVPANVRQVHYLRQVHGKPSGHRFATENGTALKDHGLLEAGFTHTDADDSERFHQLVQRVFAGAFPQIRQRWGI